MPAMKVTTDAAMRARDVSRPMPEHFAWAEAAEASAVDATGGAVAAAVGSSLKEDVAAEAEVLAEVEPVVKTEVVIETEVVAEPGVTEGTRRRRVRGGRSSSRRGRPSR